MHTVFVWDYCNATFTATPTVTALSYHIVVCYSENIAGVSAARVICFNLFRTYLQRITYTVQVQLHNEYQYIHMCTLDYIFSFDLDILYRKGINNCKHARNPQ